MLVKAMFTVLFVVGLIGSIVFFPVPIDRRSTCIADHHLLGGKMAAFDAPPSRFGQPHMRSRLLLQRYMNTYAFLWWSSLLLAGVSAWILRRLYRSSRN